MIGLGYHTSKNRIAGNQRGFTLIELIIAISILSVILVVGYGTVSQISRGKRILDDNRDSVLIAQAVLRRMVRELSQSSYDQANARGIIPVSGTSSNGARPYLLAAPPTNLGSGTLITFLTENTFLGKRSSHPESDLVQVSYALAKDPTQKNSNLYQLVRGEMPYLDVLSLAKKEHFTAPITSSVRSLRFRFFDKTQKRWIGRWGDTPQTQQHMPCLIQLDLLLETPLGRKYQVKTSVPVRCD